MLQESSEQPRETEHQGKVEVALRRAVGHIAEATRLEVKVRSNSGLWEVIEVRAGWVCRSQSRSRAQVQSGLNEVEGAMALERHAVTEPWLVVEEFRMNLPQSLALALSLALDFE